MRRSESLGTAGNEPSHLLFEGSSFLMAFAPLLFYGPLLVNFGATHNHKELNILQLRDELKPNEGCKSGVLGEELCSFWAGTPVRRRSMVDYFPGCNFKTKLSILGDGPMCFVHMGGVQEKTVGITVIGSQPPTKHLRSCTEKTVCSGDPSAFTSGRQGEDDLDQVAAQARGVEGRVDVIASAIIVPSTSIIRFTHHHPAAMLPYSHGPIYSDLRLERPTN